MNDFHGELRRILMNRISILDRVTDWAYGAIGMAILIGALVLAGGCGDNAQVTHREATADMVAETRVYAERCALPSWLVNDYVRVMCDVTEICEVQADGSCRFVPGPLVQCDAPAPAEWDLEACADALAALPCADYIALPAECAVLVPWERGT